MATGRTGQILWQEKISKGEPPTKLFPHQQFDMADYRARQSQLTEVSSRYKELNESVMNAQIDLKGYTEELEEVRGKMENLSSTVTDTDC